MPGPETNLKDSKGKVIGQLNLDGKQLLIVEVVPKEDSSRFLDINFNF